MKISIIVPVYNGEETIDQCLNALVDQDYAKNDFEIIVVDGCSTDRTPEIVSKVLEKAKNLGIISKYIRSPEREGRLLARINGSNEATYNLLLFIDSRCIADRNILKNIESINYQPIIGNPIIELIDSMSRFFYLVRKKIYDKYLREEFVPFNITKDNFEKSPKGTTIFFCDKELFLSSQPRDRSKNVSDDTKLLWNIVQKKKILKHRDVKVKYLPRKSLEEEIKHTFHRGPKFVDYYFDLRKERFWIFIFSPLILLFSMILLYVHNSVYFIYSMYLLFFMNLLIALWISENNKDFFNFLFLFPIIGLAFELGILKGLIIKIIDSVRASALDLWISKLLLVSSFLTLIYYTWFIGFSVKIITCLVFIIIGSLIPLILRNKEYVLKEGVIAYAKTYRLLLNIAFINIFTISILLLFNDLYIRPISYFILISILSVLIFLETEISDYKLILPKILLLSVNLRIGLLYKFPSITGGDGAYHYGLIKEALLSGDIVGKAAFYSEYSIPHINTMIHMLMPGLNYKDALTISWAFPRIIISVIFVYLLGRELFNEKIGLISSLLIVLYPFDIWHSSHLAPMTFGNAIIPIMLYFLMLRKTNYHFLFGIVTIIIIANSHPLTMVIVLVITFGLFIGSLFYKIIDKKSPVFPFILVLFIFFTKWAYFSRSFWVRRIINNISDIYTLTILILKKSIFSLETGYVIGNLSSFDEMLNTLGFSIFLCISVIGILFILRRKNKTIQIVEMLFATVLMATIVIGFSSIGVWIIPHRWFGPLGMLLAIPAAIGIQRALVKKSLSAIIMFILAFFMITNSIANQDSSIYAYEDTVRWAFTESEMYAADWSFQKSNGILTDSSYRAYIRSLPFIYELPKISGDDGVILIRDYILEHAFYKSYKNILNVKYERGIGKRLSPSRILILNENEKNIIINLGRKFSKVYCNEDVKAYYQDPLDWIDEDI